MGDGDDVAELRNQVATLLARVDDLERRLTPSDHVLGSAPDLALVPPDDPTGADPSTDHHLAHEPTDLAAHPAGASRRHLLRSVGVAAAGAVGSAVVLGAATAGPAAAADGATMKVGESHTGSGANSVTRLNNTSFQVEGGPTSPISAVHAGIGINAVSGYAQGANGNGVRGYASNTGAGVSADSMKGHGVMATTDGAGKAAVSAATTAAGAVGVLASSTNGPALQVLAGPSMPPSTKTWTAGSLVMNGGHLWYCYQGGFGEVSKWSRVSGTFTALAGSTRVYDSRPGTQPPVGTKARFDDGTIRAISASTNGAILPGASAALLNVVATETNAAGYFSFWRNGLAWPGTSSINWNRPDTTIANSVVVALDANGRFQARMAGIGGAHLVVDVVGFYL